ncbi:hypothetical protein GF359_03695, partial [candidate division WOR-3 bacterium]|nr:hypothetical protein [candidate division WOR-3 bacterium]MBD3364299.1 hypothetical protein [candidate division WOR-3 bacterium]
MPKFIPKSEKKDEEKKAEQVKEKKEEKKPVSEEDELKKLEAKFGKQKKEGEGDDMWKKMKTEGSGEKTSVQDKMTEYEISKRAAPPPGSISREDPDFISSDELEKRRRELNMLETRINNLEKEEQDINQRLNFLRKEHSAMELAIKEKAHLEREIAELREDRNRVKGKLDELKEQEGELENKTWEELKKSPAIGARISSLERRIHELEGQILELNEQRLRSGMPAVTPKSSESKPETLEEETPRKTLEKPEPAEKTSQSEGGEKSSETGGKK